MQFYEINICRIIIFSFYAAYKTHDEDKNWSSKSNYSSKCSNNFAADYKSLYLKKMQEIIMQEKIRNMKEPW